MTSGDRGNTYSGNLGLTAEQRRELREMHRRANIHRRFDAIEDEKRKAECLNIVNPRICKTCRRIKPENDFSSYLGPDNVRRYHRRCIACRSRLYLRSRECKAKRALLWQMLSVPCDGCGLKYPPQAMRFWRIVGRGMFDMNTAWTGRSVEAIKAERSNHSALCLNCIGLKKFEEKEIVRPLTNHLADLPPDLRALTDLPDLDARPQLISSTET